MNSIRFGRLVVAFRASDYIKPDGRKEKRWHCLCDCGAEVDVHQSSLVGGTTKSCGCFQKLRAAEANTKHGLTVRGAKPPPTYHSWAAMIQRCTNPNNHKWPLYGGRGIKVCDQWKNFEQFRKDMGDKPSAAMSIERLNNNGHYEPGNCIWATRLEQANNTRTNHFIKIGTKILTIAQWERELGVPPETFKSRIVKGWSDERAILTPVVSRR